MKFLTHKIARDPRDVILNPGRGGRTPGEEVAEVNVCHVVIVDQPRGHRRYQQMLEVVTHPVHRIHACEHEIIFQLIYALIINLFAPSSVFFYYVFSVSVKNNHCY